MVTGALKDLEAGRIAVVMRDMDRIMLHAPVGPSMQPLAQQTRANVVPSSGFAEILSTPRVA